MDVLPMMSMLCRVNDSLWATLRSRCEWGGLAVSLGWILVVSRVTGYFGRPLAVGVYWAESI